MLTVLSGAVSGGLRYFDRVSDVSGVDTYVSSAVSGYLFDFDSVTRGDIGVSIDQISLSGSGDAVVSFVDESVCCVNSVLAAGVLDLCGVNTVVSGVDEPVCGVSSLLTAAW